MLANMLMPENETPVAPPPLVSATPSVEKGPGDESGLPEPLERSSFTPSNSLSTENVKSETSDQGTKQRGQVKPARFIR